MTSPYPRTTPPSPRQNRLLAALPPADLDALAPELELVSLKVGETVHGPGRKFHFAYFPTAAIVSLHYLTESGAACEVAGVGNEGVVGVSLFLGGDTSSSAAVVQTAGQAYRLESRALKREFARAGALQHVLLLYTQALIIQTSQSVVCTRHHSIEQQLCRWLLLTLDRSPTPQLLMTQEMIAGMFGVRRESITDAAGRLQRAGFISYRRGHISVLDRDGLQAGACECYGLLKRELNRLLPAAGLLA